MKIMLQGYLHNANFGDVLSAYLFYRRCQNAGFEEIDLYQYKDYGIGSFCRKQLDYTNTKSLISCFRSDSFVIISGGSFWNNNHFEEDAKVRYKRFILPALLYIFMKKPVYILGVGGGAVDTPWLRKKMVKLLNKAKVVTFRDDFTKKVFDDYGVKNNTTVTADTVLTIKKEQLNELEEKHQLEMVAKGRKKLLLHLPDSLWADTYITKNILPALIPFLNEHKDYLLVLSNDNIRSIDDAEKSEIDKIYKMLKDSDIEFYDYKYHDCWQMCSLINEMDCVITLKLHVGVVGCALDKCVISFPVHREKTDNFYQMIGESERCVNVKNLDTEIASQQINKFYNKPVHISDELREKAEQNLAVIDNIILKNNK